MAHKNVVFKHIDKIYSFFLSALRKKEVEKIIFLIAIVAFILHLTLIALTNIGIIPINGADNKSSLKLLSAIYTPFTIILLYEIYSLIYYLPKSLTIYLGKQYEIIVLILIRKIFYDLSNASVTSSPLEFSQIQDILITFTSLIVFCLLIFCFYKLSGNRCMFGDERKYDGDRSIKYVMAKKTLAIGLLLLFIILLIWSFTAFRYISPTIDNTILILKQMNNTFFNTFFTALILTEVLVLLLSFSLTEQFHKIIRNSGFIISTILLKLSFKTEGFSNIVIVFGAIAFGVAILGVYRLFEQKLFCSNKQKV